MAFQDQANSEAPQFEQLGANSEQAKASAQAYAESLQQGRNREVVVFKILKNDHQDPVITEVMGDLLQHKNGVSPKAVSDILIVDDGNYNAVQSYEQAIATDATDAFWQTNDGAILRQALEASAPLIRASLPAETVEAEVSPGLIEAQACWDAIKDQFDPPCPTKSEHKMIEGLAARAGKMDLLEMALERPDFLVGKLQPQVDQLRAIAAENKVQAAENDNQEKENKIEAAENESQAIKMQEILKIIEKAKNSGSMTKVEIDKVLALEDWSVFEGEEAKQMEAMKASLEGIRANIDSALAIIDPADPAYAEVQQIFAAASYDWRETSPEAQFKDVLAAVEDSSLTDQQKNAIAAQLGVTPDIIKTGSDVQTALNIGYQDPNTGEIKKYDADHPAKIDEATYVYEKDAHTRTVRVDFPNGKSIEADFSSEASGNHVGQVVYTVQMMYQMGRLNLEEALFQRGFDLVNGGKIDIHYDDIIRAKKIGDVMIGGNSGYKGTLVERNTWLSHRVQGLSSDGDERSWTNNPGQSVDDLEGLGIIKDGTIDWKQFERVGTELQAIESRNGQPNYQELVKEFGPETEKSPETLNT